MLNDAVDSYLAVRRSVGFELEVPEYLLRSYARFAITKGDMYVKAQTVIDWASLAPSKTQRFNRLTTVCRFANHVQVEDQHHEVPPRDIFGHRKTRPSPFIFTLEETNRLLLAASQLGPVGSLRPDTYTTLFALLVTTGLRISEALALVVDDLSMDGLLIRETKFKKTRIVPLHETTKTELEKYLCRRKQVRPLDSHIFTSLRKTGLKHSGVTWTWRKILAEIGLNPLPCGRRRPRIHDLRHTFACRALESCPQGRKNVDRHIRALSTYMGHVHVSDTYWYLESTPQLMKTIANACEAMSQGGELCV